MHYLGRRIVPELLMSCLRHLPVNPYHCLKTMSVTTTLSSSVSLPLSVNHVAMQVRNIIAKDAGDGGGSDIGEEEDIANLFDQLTINRSTVTPDIVCNWLGVSQLYFNRVYVTLDHVFPPQSMLCKKSYRPLEGVGQRDVRVTMSTTPCYLTQGRYKLKWKLTATKVSMSVEEYEKCTGTVVRKVEEDVTYIAPPNRHLSWVWKNL